MVWWRWCAWAAVAEARFGGRSWATWTLIAESRFRRRTVACTSGAIAVVSGTVWTARAVAIVSKSVVGAPRTVAVAIIANVWAVSAVTSIIVVAVVAEIWAAVAVGAWLAWTRTAAVVGAGYDTAVALTLEISGIFSTVYRAIVAAAAKVRSRTRYLSRQRLCHHHCRYDERGA